MWVLCQLSAGWSGFDVIQPRLRREISSFNASRHPVDAVQNQPQPHTPHRASERDQLLGNRRQQLAEAAVVDAALVGFDVNKLEGKIALITGDNSGIGLATAKRRSGL